MDAKERIKAVRKALGLNQQEFAEKIKISQSLLAGIETGRKVIQDRHIQLISMTFRVSENWLRTGEGEMFVQLSRDGEIAAFVGKALSDESDTFKKRFIAALSQLDEPEWELLEKMVMKIVETKKDQA
ncbi:MAG: helix-turn-helix domain-containing protein [Clostridia bacterium]|nr:helix-turn-helix domain-containing protein [Clostridia bacterium]